MSLPCFGKSFTKFDVHSDFNKDEKKRKTAWEVNVKAAMTEGIFWILFTLPWGHFLPVWGCSAGGENEVLQVIRYTRPLRMTKDSIEVMPRLKNVGYWYAGFFIFSIRWTVTIGAKGLWFWFLFSSIMFQLSRHTRCVWTRYGPDPETCQRGIFLWAVSSFSELKF